MKRAITLALALTMGQAAMAGSLSLVSNTFAGLFDETTLSLDSTQFNNDTANYTGTSMTGSVATSSYTSLSDDTAYAANTSSAQIFSEGSGAFQVKDTFETYTFVEGGSMYTENSGGTYTFTTSTPVDFVLYYNATYTGTGTMNGFGLWNPYLNVDGVTYQWAQLMTPPAAFNEYVIPLAAGTHTLGVRAWSNIGIGPGIGSESMTENIHFYTEAVPEPAPIAMLGLGVLGLLIRRRRK